MRRLLLLTAGMVLMSGLGAWGAESALSDIKLTATPLPLLKRDGDKLVQPVKLEVNSSAAAPVEAELRVEGLAPQKIELKPGAQIIEVDLPAAETERTLQIELAAAGKVAAKADLTLKPVRKMTLFLLPHSHVDIGYTQLQTDVEKKQMANIAKGLELAKATADYPEGARYRWNVEVLWAVESFLKQQPPEKQQEFIDGVKKGWIGLEGMYGNTLTGLCRPEELVRLFRYATELGDRCGVKVQSAMISDVPGYTWGTVSAMAQAGIKYWSIGPNYGDRIGYTMSLWENKPFWWVGPNGKDKVLCWISYNGYAWSHILKQPPTPAAMTELMNKLEKAEYPYDLIYIRWSGYGDNAVPDEKIPDFAKAWNEHYASPRVVIATVDEAFGEMERRYGDKLPKYTGDWTPYWEDGAASSALETSLNRNAADRLVQAETLWAMLRPQDFPAADFRAAWRNVVLYSEHTWGAYNSISEPDSDFVKNQWKIKQAFAVDADKQSRELQWKSLEIYSPQAFNECDIYNTTSWPRGDLVVLPPKTTTFPGKGDGVMDEHNHAVYSQRLASGQLAFLPGLDIAPFSSRRFTLGAGEPVQPSGKALARGTMLQSEQISLRLDEKTGSIVELRAAGLDANLAGAHSIALNDFFFVAGADSKNPQHASNVKVSVKDPGPLVASLVVQSDAPGCNQLTREIRLVAGQDYIEIFNTIDKKRIDDAAHAKEGLHFGYAFNVPGGVMRLDTPWAVIHPEIDQLPGACKNWVTVGRWVDISNDQYGVTWATLDAPLVEVGGLTANMIGSQTNPRAWMNKLEPSQTFYSWVMNNHWHTNYRAYQEGPTVFRYAIRPHKAFKAVEAMRFATGLTQPLLDCGALNATRESRLMVQGDGVIVTAFKPSDDGKAYIVRLFGSSDKPAKATLQWSEPKPGTVWLSDTSEKALKEISGPIDVPAWTIVTLRVDRK